MKKLPESCASCNRRKLIDTHKHHIVLAYFYACASILLVFIGFYVEPLGLIASSVITAAGIFSGFAAAYMGLKDVSTKLITLFSSGKQENE